MKIKRYDHTIGTFGSLDHLKRLQDENTLMPRMYSFDEVRQLLKMQKAELIDKIYNDIREFRKRNPGWSKLNAWWIEARDRI